MPDPFPNPATNEISIPFIIPEKDELNIYLYDDKGMEVLKYQLSNVNKGLNIYKLNTASMRSGIYEYSVYYKGQILSKRFIKN